jgi:membrane protease YdiL (CAAX protease family)
VISKRRLPIWALLGLSVMFVLVPQTVSLFTFGADRISGGYESVGSAIASEMVPDFGGAVIAAIAIGMLGWWALVWREPLRTNRWVWIVPITLLGFSVVVTDYANLAQVGPALVATLAVSTLATGLSEELMFRGIALQAFRDRVSEGWAAALSSGLFGALHLINALVTGSGAIVQALLASVLGYFLYLTRRVSGGILLPIVVHWVFDFSAFSTDIGLQEPPTSDTAFYGLLVVLALSLVLLAMRRRITPVRQPRTSDDPSGGAGLASHEA